MARVHGELTATGCAWPDPSWTCGPLPLDSPRRIASTAAQGAAARVAPILPLIRVARTMTCRSIRKKFESVAGNAIQGITATAQEMGRVARGYWRPGPVKQRQGTGDI